MSRRRYSEPAREYFAGHGIPQEVADILFRPDESGFTIPYFAEDGDIMFSRHRDLAAGKAFQPSGIPLDLYMPMGAGPNLLVTEGEPDCAAAISAIFEPDEVGTDLVRRRDLPPPLVDLTPIALPGAGVCHGRLADLVEQLGASVTVAFDADDAGRAAAEKLRTKIPTAAVVRLPDGADMADVLAAADDPVETLAELVAEAEAAAVPDQVDVDDHPQVEAQPPELVGELLDKVLAFLDRYVVLPGDNERFALALWVAHTYSFDGAHATPYMLVLSAEKRSGKTRCLEVLGLLVANPWPVIGASEAAIFRKIDRDRPTMLMDEIDALWASHTERTEPLRAILNAGNRPGASVARCTGEGGTNVEDFSVYCPKGGFGIDNGRTPDTLRDRSVVIRMARKTTAEPVERFRHRIAAGEAEPIRQALAGWGAGAAVDILLQAEPELPLDLDDRAAEAWEPLLAIADLAGGEWPERARAAARALSSDGDRDEVTTGTMLLGAIKEAFGERDRITTAELLEKINADEELPFGGWSDGKGLDGRRLAKLLKPYKVKPRPIRIDGDVSKGYLRAQLEEVWERWLPHPAGTVTSVTTVTGDDEVTPDSALPAGCNSVTDVTPETDMGGAVTATIEGEAEAQRVAEKFEGPDDADLFDSWMRDNVGRFGMEGT